MMSCQTNGVKSTVLGINYGHMNLGIHLKKSADLSIKPLKASLRYVILFDFI